MSVVAQRSYPNTCEKCGAQPFQQCRSLTTGKLTDTHAVRLQKTTNRCRGS